MGLRQLKFQIPSKRDETADGPKGKSDEDQKKKEAPAKQKKCLRKHTGK